MREMIIPIQRQFYINFGIAGIVEYSYRDRG